MAQFDRARRRSKTSRKQPLQAPHSHLDGRASRSPTARSENSPSSGALETPDWHEDSRELTFFGRLVKRLRQPAHCQELIFKEFQKKGWPTRMENPLPRRHGKDPKQDLRTVIKNLNRHQHFRGLHSPYRADHIYLTYDCGIIRISVKGLTFLF